MFRWEAMIDASVISLIKHSTFVNYNSRVALTRKLLILLLYLVRVLRKL